MGGGGLVGRALSLEPHHWSDLGVEGAVEEGRCRGTKGRAEVDPEQVGGGRRLGSSSLSRRSSGWSWLCARTQSPAPPLSPGLCMPSPSRNPAAWAGLSSLAVTKSLTLWGPDSSFVKITWKEVGR